MLKKLILTNTLIKMNPLIDVAWLYMAKELYESKDAEFQSALESITEQIKNELNVSLQNGSLSLRSIERDLDEALSLIIPRPTSNGLDSNKRGMKFYKTTASAIRKDILNYINDKGYKTLEYSKFQERDYEPEDGVHSEETLIAIALQKSIGYLYNHIDEDNFITLSAITRMFDTKKKMLSKADKNISFNDFIKIFKAKRTVEVITALSIVSSGWELDSEALGKITKSLNIDNISIIKDVLKEAEIIDEYNRLLVNNAEEFLTVFEAKEKENKIDYYKLTGKKKISDNERNKTKKVILKELDNIWSKPRIKNKLGYGKSVIHLRALNEKLTLKDFELIVDMVKKEPLKYVNLLTIRSVSDKLLSLQQKEIIHQYKVRQEELLKGSNPDHSQNTKELEQLLKEKEEFAKKLVEILTPTLEDEKKFNIELFKGIKGLTVNTILDRYHSWQKHNGKTAGIGIQDRDFFLCVEYVEGSPLNVAGIPEKELFQFYHEFGILTTPPDILDKYWPHKEEQLKIDSEQTISLITRHQELQANRNKRAQAVMAENAIKKAHGTDKRSIIKKKFEAIRYRQMSKEYFDIFREVKKLSTFVESKTDTNDEYYKNIKTIADKLVKKNQRIKEKFKKEFGYEIPNGYLNRNQFSNEDRIEVNELLDELDAQIWKWDEIKDKHWDSASQKYKSDNIDTPVSFSEQEGINSDVLHKVLDLAKTSSWEGNKARHFNGFLAFEKHLKNLSSDDITDIGKASIQYIKEKESLKKDLETLLKKAKSPEHKKELKNHISELVKEIEVIKGTIANEYSVIFDSILSGNRESRGVEQIDKMLKDDRNALFEYINTISQDGEEPQNIILTVGNSGKEAMMSLWLGYLLLSQGHNVTLSAKSKPMNQFDCNILELKYVTHYFDGILKAKSERAKGLGDFAKKGQLHFAEIDNLEQIEKLSLTNSEGKPLQNKLAVLTGELWYSNIVGKSDLKKPPYNTLDNTALFSIHVHKTPSKPLAVLDKQVTTRTGDYVDRSITTGWKICQMFLPEAVELKKAEGDDNSEWEDGWRRFNMEFKPFTYDKDNNIISNQDFDLTKMLKDEKTKAKIVEQIVKECKSYVGVKELAKGLKPNKNGDGFIFQYWTPQKFVEITVNSKSINVELLMDYDEKNERVEREGGTPWDDVKSKIPNLINAVFWGIAKEQAEQKGLLLLTNDAKERLIKLNINTETINASELKSSNVISSEKEILDVTIPTMDLNQHLLSDFKGSLMVQIIKKKSNGEYIKELIPALRTEEGIKCRFTNLTDNMQIVDIIGISNDNKNKKLARFVDDSKIDDFVYQFSTDKNSKSEQKYELTPKELSLSAMQAEKVLIAPVDKYTTMENRVKWNTIHNDGDDHVAYTELIRLGCIWSKSHTYNPLYWEDPNYITAIPRMTISSHEGPLVFQLAGPHNLPIEQADDNIFPDHALLTDEEKNQRIANYFAKAAQLAEYMGASAIDINMGGPALANQKGGIYLAQENPELAYEIVRTINKAVKIPVCVKTRLFREKDGLPTVDINKTVEFIQNMTTAGAKWVAIHTRVWHEGTTSEGKARNKRNELRQVIQLVRDAKNSFSDEEIKILQIENILDERGYLNTSQFDQLLSNMQETNIIDKNWQPINNEEFKITNNPYSNKENVDMFNRLKALRTLIYANGEVYNMDDIEKAKEIGTDGVMIWAAMHKDPDAAQKMKKYYIDGTPFTSTITGTKEDLLKRLIQESYKCFDKCHGCPTCKPESIASNILKSRSNILSGDALKGLKKSIDIKTLENNISSILSLSGSNSGIYNIIIDENGVKKVK